MIVIAYCKRCGKVGEIDETPEGREFRMICLARGCEYEWTETA